jgi:predicted dehydrogenase
MTQIKRREFVRTVGKSAVGVAAAAPLLSMAATSAENSRPIKVGQIGTAHAHASGKMATLRKLSRDFEVVGVVEPDPELRRECQDVSAYRGLKWISEDELLSTPGLQAVAVETAVADLVPTAARCIDAGMHIHLDKPAGESLSEFKRVMDQAAGRRLTVQMGYMFRNNRAFEFAFRAVREGWLGQVFELHAVMSKMVSAEVRLPLAQYPGGTMFELGCHLIDAVVTILGKPDRVTPFARRTLPEQDDLVDNMLAVFEYPKTTCTVRSSVIEVDGGRRRQFVICGNRGTIEIRPLEPPKLLLTLDKPQGPFKRGYQEVELSKMPGRYDDQLAELARVIRGEEESKYPPQHDLAVHETILRASDLPVD